MNTLHGTPKRTLATLLAAAAALAMLSGCGMQTIQEDWNVKASLPALPTYYVEVAAKELPGICGNHPGMKLHGCAKRDYKARTCTIVTGPTPAAWLLDHERKHCAGFDHDGHDTLRTAATQLPAQVL